MRTVFEPHLEPLIKENLADLGQLNLTQGNFTLPRKVCLVNAMVFSVVMYGCESWTRKKAEVLRISSKDLMLLNCGVGEDS